MRKLLLCALFIAVACASGAAQGIQPKAPEVLKAGVFDYSSVEFQADKIAYQAAMSAKDYDRAREIRNEVAYRVRSTVSATYGLFEGKLYQGKAAASTALDILESGLTGLITLTGKEGWAAILSIVKGGRASFDKNFFNAQTMAILIQQMRAARLRVITRMDESLATRSVQEYPLAKALDDCVELFNAGTLQGGLMEASQSAGANLQAAQNDAAAARARIQNSNAVPQQ